MAGQKERTMTAQTKVGIIGCGTISDTYIRIGQTFAGLDIVACADIDGDRARARAAQYNLQAYSVPELLADSTIDLVVNLTIPHAHAEVALAALQAGKSVYNEKPLAITREDGLAMLELARTRGLLLGGAPDTFLGGGIQTCIQLIDEGVIGRPLGGSAAMLCHGHEHWHPDPAFYYQAGGGPLFDMGPYYLTALVALLGPLRSVTGFARITEPVRTITSQPRAGQTIQVEVPTHVAGVLEFAQGAIVSLTTSFAVWATQMPIMEIYGTAGTLSVPDPNTFGGSVRVYRQSTHTWEEVTITRPYTANSRGLGLADLAEALHTQRAPRASGTLAYHVLDAMHALYDASTTGQAVLLTSTCERPAPLPLPSVSE